ncbi:MAG: HAD family hydrolase [Thermaerobacter sp.]|nr:HAD family hydrolase [Thermaerobacter sp.]
MTAVLFDLDGTLTDTLPLVVTALNAALAPHWGAPKDLEAMRPLFGPSEERLIAREAPGDPDAVDRFYAEYRREHARLARPFAGVTEMLHALAARGVRLGLVTNKGRRSSVMTLHEFGIAKYFGAVVTGDDVAHPKPDPTGILEVLGNLGVQPGQAAYVGDSRSDMQAAHAAGVRAIGAGWQAGDIPLADVTLRAPEELLFDPWLQENAQDGGMSR